MPRCEGRHAAGYAVRGRAIVRRHQQPAGTVGARRRIRAGGQGVGGELPIWVFFGIAVADQATGTVLLEEAQERQAEARTWSVERGALVCCICSERWRVGAHAWETRKLLHYARLDSDAFCVVYDQV